MLITVVSVLKWWIKDDIRSMGVSGYLYTLTSAGLVGIESSENIYVPTVATYLLMLIDNTYPLLYINQVGEKIYFSWGFLCKESSLTYVMYFNAWSLHPTRSSRHGYIKETNHPSFRRGRFREALHQTSRHGFIKETETRHQLSWHEYVKERRHQSSRHGCIRRIKGQREQKDRCSEGIDKCERFLPSSVLSSPLFPLHSNIPFSLHSGITFSPTNRPQPIGLHTHTHR